MRVYIVVDGTECEGYNVVSVHATEAGAVAAAKAKVESDPRRYQRDESYDYIDIIQWEVQE